jgi:CubicO group peptidase (beta-lactamase class C family)
MKAYFFRKVQLFCWLLIIFILVSSSYLFPRINHFDIQKSDYTYHIPENTSDSWETSSLSMAGIDSTKIYELMPMVLNGSFKNIHSILIVKNGKLVLEEYFHGYHREKRHQIRSATKSIGSILTGIAIDHKYIEDVNEKIYSYFKSYNPSIEWDKRAKDVTIKSLLTMTSGYDCDDNRMNYSCENKMYKSSDWVDYALNLPMANQPGEHWAYNSSSLILVGEIISKTSKMSIPDFADKYLFEPLGITDFQWGFSPKGRAWIAGNAEMRPRDMAKIGYMMLNHGKWKGNKIVSQEWIDESTRALITVEKANKNNLEYYIDYGYLWWSRNFYARDNGDSNPRNIETYLAGGNGGQRIYIFPTLDLIVIFTGGNYNSPLATRQETKILENYILPAIL